MIDSDCVDYVLISQLISSFSVPITVSQLVNMEFLSCCSILSLVSILSPCVRSSHRSFSFGFLDSYTYIEISNMAQWYVPQSGNLLLSILYWITDLLDRNFFHIYIFHVLYSMFHKIEELPFGSRILFYFTPIILVLI